MKSKISHGLLPWCWENELTYLTFYLLGDRQIMSGQSKASDLGLLIVSALPKPSPGNGGRGGGAMPGVE